MNDAITVLPYAPIDDLRVGMFIELELGWLSHPFPLGSFRIASAEQIETLRGLGLTRTRWCPRRSDAVAPAASPAVAADAAAAVSPEAARQRQQQAAAEQRAALRQCERQFAEAANALRSATDLVISAPERAGEQMRMLAGAIVDKMLSARELNVRLLSASASDSAATHPLNVALIALLMGRNFGLEADEMLDLGSGALMHDIGDIDLPAGLRSCDERFSGAELQRWREHVALGTEHGRRMGLRPGALNVIAQHHEQADGGGFPLKLNIDRMSAAARIVALVNRFDNLCNPAVPGYSLTPHESLSLMFAQSQNQFDTTMLSAFIRMMGVYPPGSAVQLTDDRYALVISVNSMRPLKPRVLLHDPAAPDREPASLDLETAPGLGIRRSLKPTLLPRNALQQLAPQPRVCYGFDAVAADDSEP